MQDVNDGLTCGHQLIDAGLFEVEWLAAADSDVQLASEQHRNLDRRTSVALDSTDGDVVVREYGAGLQIARGNGGVDESNNPVACEDRAYRLTVDVDREGNRNVRRVVLRLLHFDRDLAGRYGLIGELVI